MTETKLTYEKAVARLEQIVESIEQGTAGLDEIGSLVEEAQKLLEFCKNKLAKVETDVKMLLGDGKE